VGTPAVVAVGTPVAWKGVEVRSSGDPSNLGAQLVLLIGREGFGGLVRRISTERGGWSSFPSKRLAEGKPLTERSRLDDTLWLYVLEPATRELHVSGVVSGDRWTLRFDAEGRLTSDAPGWLRDDAGETLPIAHLPDPPADLFDNELVRLAPGETPEAWIRFVRRVIEATLRQKADSTWAVPAADDATCRFRLGFHRASVELPDRPQLTAGSLAGVNALGETGLISFNLLFRWTGMAPLPASEGRVVELVLALATLAARAVDPGMVAAKNAAGRAVQWAERRPDGSVMPARHRSDLDAAWATQLLLWFGEDLGSES
jgi:hypothetical protein